MVRRTLVAFGVLFAMVAAFAGTAHADHGVAHNGETAEISESEGLVQDQTVTVTGFGYAPGSTLTVVQCYIFPATGPTDCELSNFGLFTAEVGDDGTASVDYVVNVVEGRCDPDNPCFVVVSDGIGPSANGVGMEVTFAAAEAEPEPTPEPEPTEAPEPTPEPEPTEAPEPTPEPEPTEEPEPEPTEAPEPEADDADADDGSDDDGGDTDSDSNTTETASGASGDDGGGNGWVLPVVIVGALAVVGGGAFAATRGRDKS